MEAPDLPDPDRPDGHRIAFGLVVPRSFHLAQLEWWKLTLLAALFLFAPAEIYYGAYNQVFTSSNPADDPSIKLFLTIGYAVVIVLSGVGGVLSLDLLFGRLDGTARTAKRSLAAAIRAFPVAALITLVGNAPSLATFYTGTPRTWGAYVAIYLSSAVVVVALNLFIGSAAPVALEERTGPWRAILRAERLSRGNRLRLVPIILAYQLMFWSGFTLLGGLAADVTPVLAAHVGYAWMALINIPGLAVTAVVYRELRRISDGWTHEELSAVFD